MRLTVLVALGLLTACKAAEQGNELAANNAAETNEANSAASVAKPPATREEALKLMHDRHEGMEDIGDTFKVLSRTMKAEPLDVATVRTSSATIARLAPQVSGWFPPGTGPDVGKTRAKPEIWQKPKDFASKVRDFQRAAPAFDAAARGGDEAQIRASFATLGKTCKACHDLYRAPEDH